MSGRVEFIISVRLPPFIFGICEHTVRIWEFFEWNVNIEICSNYFNVFFSVRWVKITSPPNEMPFILKIGGVGREVAWVDPYRLLELSLLVIGA